MSTAKPFCSISLAHEQSYKTQLFDSNSHFYLCIHLAFTAVNHSILLCSKTFGSDLEHVDCQPMASQHKVLTYNVTNDNLWSPNEQSYSVALETVKNMSLWGYIMDSKSAQPV